MREGGALFRLIVASQCSKVSYVCVTTIYVGMAKRPYINHAVFPKIPLDDCRAPVPVSGTMSQHALSVVSRLASAILLRLLGC